MTIEYLSSLTASWLIDGNNWSKTMWKHPKCLAEDKVGIWCTIKVFWHRKISYSLNNHVVEQHNTILGAFKKIEYSAHRNLVWVVKKYLMVASWKLISMLESGGRWHIFGREDTDETSHLSRISLKMTQV